MNNQLYKEYFKERTISILLRKDGLNDERH